LWNTLLFVYGGINPSTTPPTPLLLDYCAPHTTPPVLVLSQTHKLCSAQAENRGETDREGRKIKPASQPGRDHVFPKQEKGNGSHEAVSESPAPPLLHISSHESLPGFDFVD
jgi:hypothetical protein